MSTKDTPLLAFVMLGLSLALAPACADEGGPKEDESVRSAEAREKAIRAEFEAELQAYREAPPPSLTSSLGTSPEGYRHLRKIALMGPRVLPYLVEEARRSQDINLNFPLGHITHLSFIRAGLCGPKGVGMREGLAIYAKWWDGGQKQADEMFAEAYAEGNIERIAALGWGVMPRIVEKLREDDEKLMDAVRQITIAEVRIKRIPATAVESPEAWIAWWEKNKEDWMIPFPDLPKPKREKAEASVEEETKEPEPTPPAE